MAAKIGANEAFITIGRALRNSLRMASSLPTSSATTEVDLADATIGFERLFRNDLSGGKELSKCSEFSRYSSHCGADMKPGSNSVPIAIGVSPARDWRHCFLASCVVTRGTISLAPTKLPLKIPWFEFQDALMAEASRYLKDSISTGYSWLTMRRNRCLTLAEAIAKQEVKNAKGQPQVGRFPPGLEWEILQADATILLGMTQALNETFTGYMQCM